MLFFDHIRTLKPLLHPFVLWRRYLSLEASHKEALERNQKQADLLRAEVYRNIELENELEAQSHFRISGPRYLTPAEKSETELFLELCKIRTCSVELIRVGSKSDGGYLIPKLSTEYDLVISGGIDSNSDFETELAKAGARVIAADFSIDKLPGEHPNIQFYKKYISDLTLGEKLVSLEDLIGKYAEQPKNPLLKLDIEGGEWSALRSIKLETLAMFSTLVIEFHWMENAENSQALNTIKQVFSKILLDFDLVHVHPNNNAKAIKLFDNEIPSVFEATFLNKRENGQSTIARTLNTSLDSDNNPDLSGFGLSNLWFER